jgi:hypothetical protein
LYSNRELAANKVQMGVWPGPRIMT